MDALTIVLRDAGRSEDKRGLTPLASAMAPAAMTGVLTALTIGEGTDL